MKGLTKIGTGLIVVFAVVLVAILAELTYALWRRRRFRQRALEGGAPDVMLSGDSLRSTLPSKELLYFFCWKNQSRIEPAGTGPRPPALPVSTPPTQPSQPESTEDDDSKWKQAVLYGQARFLFTIKEEEERELQGAETPNRSSTEVDRRGTTRVSLEERLAEDGVESDRDLAADGKQETTAVAIDVNDDEKLVLTPFSTPCASPQYYTPSPSPTRDGSLPF